MSEPLRMLAHPQATIPRGACVLCGQPCPGLNRSVGLYDGRTHLGDMCQRCLLAGRRGATARARERAVVLRRLDERVTANGSGDPRQVGCLPWLRRYADYLDSLAARLEMMVGWGLTE